MRLIMRIEGVYSLKYISLLFIDDMIRHLFVVAACVMLGMSAQAKDYKYETVEGDMMQTRIYTLDNGFEQLQIYKRFLLFGNLF